MRFPNLEAEMSRHGIDNRALSNRIGISLSSVSNKLNGRTEFNLSEMRGIKAVFPGCTYEYLFEAESTAHKKEAVK